MSSAPRRACHRLPCGPRRAQSVRRRLVLDLRVGVLADVARGVGGRVLRAAQQHERHGDRGDHAAPDQRRAVAADVGDPAEDGLEDDSAAGAHQRVEREHGRALLRRDHVVEVRAVDRVVDRGRDAPQQRRARWRPRSCGRARARAARARSRPSRAGSTTCDGGRACAPSGAIAPPTIAAPDSSAAASPATVYASVVAPQFEQVGLQRVEHVDADAGGERAREHQPAHRRVAEPVLDRRAEHRARRLDRVLAALGSEADVVHQQRGDDEHDREDAGADQERHAEVGELRDHAAEHRAGEHRDAAHDLRAAEDRLEAAVVAGGLQGVDEPGIHRAGEEREPETEQHRHDRPRPERRLPHPQQPVQRRRHRRASPCRSGRTPAARRCRPRRPSGSRRSASRR